jgi:lipoprotein NlpD
MKSLWITLISVLLLSACGYGWKQEPAVYPPSDKGAVVASQQAVGAGEYLVQPGDTLFAIGFRQQIDYHDLASWNGIGPDYLIRVGQVLRLTPPTDAPTTRPLSKPVPIIAGPVPVPPTEPGPGPVTLPPVAPPPVVAPVVPVLSVPPVAKPMPRGNAGTRWLWPTTGEVIRNYSIAAGSKGIDISGELGQPVQAVAAGKVVYSGSALKGYGELVIVKHDDTYLSAYGHNRRRLVKEGDAVRAGQTIAELGIGPEQKPILHFEIRENGKPVEPLDFLPRR